MGFSLGYWNPHKNICENLRNLRTTLLLFLGVLSALGAIHRLRLDRANSFARNPIAVFGLMIALLGLTALSAFAGEPIVLNQWRVCSLADADFQKKAIPPGAEWLWVGHPFNSFTEETIFAHRGPFAYYVHCHLDPFPDNARPILLINGLPEGCVVLQYGKPLEQIQARQKGSDAYSVERWFRLASGRLRTVPGDNTRLEIWAPSIRKSLDPKAVPLSMIVYEDPDLLAERVRQKKLRQPYLHEVDETEDPYVARHW